jgi:hypothetical protein
MKKEELLSLGLTEDQANTILTEFIPKDRFNEVNEAKKQALETIKERDLQLEDLKKSSNNLEDLKKSITDLQAKNKQNQEKYEQEVLNLKLNNAIDVALINAGARNIKSVKALLDLSKLAFENDKVNGLDDQITTLKGGDTSFLFNDNNAIAPNGMKLIEGNGKPTEKPKAEWGYSDWVKHYNTSTNEV